VIWDPTAKAYRAFSSIGTGTANGVAAAIANFAGWGNTYLEPQSQTSKCGVQVLRRGVVELILATPAAVTTQTLLTPVLETVGGVTRVSNYTVDITTTAADALYRVIKVCDCGTCVKKPCPPTAAAVTSGNATLASASTPLVYPTVRTVLAEFNLEYRSKA
jgi:hypothetical protein